MDEQARREINRLMVAGHTYAEAVEVRRRRQAADAARRGQFAHIPRYWAPAVGQFVTFPDEIPADRDGAR